MERSLRLVGVLTPTPGERFHTSTFVIRYSIFCGSLFSPTADCQSNQSNHQQTVPFWRSFIQGVQGFWVSLVPRFYLGMQLHKKFQFVFLFRDTAVSGQFSGVQRLRVPIKSKQLIREL